MSRAGIEQLLYVMEEAFEGNHEHSLLANLRSLRDGDWGSAAAGGKRTVFEIAQHVGECKFMYENHAFGDGSMHWSAPDNVPSVERDASAEDVIAWLREVHRTLRASIEALRDDAELVRPRKANWGTDHETRWLINVMVQHDLYHAGEINHLRALRQGNDEWAHPLPLSVRRRGEIELGRER